MGVMKRRHSNGERSHPIAAHGGMYRMSDNPGVFHWAGLGPRPAFRFEGCEASPYVEDHRPAPEPVGATKQEMLF